MPSAFVASLALCGVEDRGLVEQLQRDLVRAQCPTVLFVLPAAVATNSWRVTALGHSDALLCVPSAALLTQPEEIALLIRWAAQRPLVLLLTGLAPKSPERAALLRALGEQRVQLAATPDEAVAHLLRVLRPGMLRKGTECRIPLLLWRSPSFQSWYQALRHAGHELEDAELEWTHRVRSPGRPPFLWAVRPRVRIANERRQIGGEVVIGRADISAVVLYRQVAHTEPGRHEVVSHEGPVRRTGVEVVMVREYRAATRNALGFAWMLPGGSAARASERAADPLATAVQEILEETGLRIVPSQLTAVPSGDRQLVASLSSHHAQLFRAELSDAQVAQVQAAQAAGRPFGATPTERCYVHLRPLTEILADPSVDWSQLGMLSAALRDLPAG